MAAEQLSAEGCVQTLTLARSQVVIFLLQDSFAVEIHKVCPSLVTYRVLPALCLSDLIIRLDART